MRLMVAGCSYSSISDSHPGTSWSEVIAARLGWQLDNISRRGCSNGGIRIQIDEILQQRPDFAVITPTFWDRMEIPSQTSQFDWRNSPEELQEHLRSRGTDIGYDRKLGLKNINYDLSGSRLICETTYTMAENIPNEYRPQLSKSVQTAVQQYINFMYDSDWKKQLDEWIITDGIFRLYHADIKFIVQPFLLWPFEPSRPWRQCFPDAIPDRFIADNDLESLLSICGDHPPAGRDPGYHGSPRSQVIIAQNIIRRMDRDFGVRI